MGREIRRVPPGWEHPKPDGVYTPLRDEDYETAAAEWTRGNELWQKGEHPEQIERYNDKPVSFNDWHGSFPDRSCYRSSRWTEEPTHYQIYETVSEGTPVSPVFADLDEMEMWLLQEGYSPHAAATFCKTGYAPSLFYSPERGLSQDIHSLDHLGPD